MGIMRMGGRLLSDLIRKPATRNYPEEGREYPAASRGRIVFKPSDCILCNICGRKCPADAIHADKIARTLSIERMQCIQCSYCVESCPKNCLAIIPGYTPPNETKVTDVYEVPKKD